MQKLFETNKEELINSASPTDQKQKIENQFEMSDFLKLLPEANPIPLIKLQDEPIKTVYKLKMINISETNTQMSNQGAQREALQRLKSKNFSNKKFEEQEFYNRSVENRKNFADIFNQEQRVVYRTINDPENPKNLTQQRIDLAQLTSNSLENNWKTTEADNPHHQTVQDIINTNNCTLSFESQFESGNLAYAYQDSENEYSLLLQNDVNTNGYTQWFYFRVENHSLKGPVKFNILNFTQSKSLFSEGMKVMVYSEKQKEEQNIGWVRNGNNIIYYPNAFLRTNERNYSTLSFTFNFQREDDKTFFAYNQPYTYSELQSYLEEIEKNPKNAKLFTRQLLTRTLAGNRVDLITITNIKPQDFIFSREGLATAPLNFRNNHSGTPKGNSNYHSGNYHQANNNPVHQIYNPTTINNNNNNINNIGNGNNRDYLNGPTGVRNDINDNGKQFNKKGIVITARVHPGETVGSFMMKGVIDFLLSDSQQANLLREKFIFKIIPMLNPDGVIHGNYRCSLVGQDLNRRWQRPCKIMHPEIYMTKQFLYEFSQKHEIIYFADLHGHSNKKNVFIYGCNEKERPEACREFPYILSKVDQNFSFDDCNFLVQQSQEGTARIAVWNEFQITNTFTIEASFCGPSTRDVHFSKQDLEQMGQSVCQALTIQFENYLKQTPSTNTQNEKQSVSGSGASEVKVKNRRVSQLSIDDSREDIKKKTTVVGNLNKSDQQNQKSGNNPYFVSPTTQHMSSFLDQDATPVVRSVKIEVGGSIREIDFDLKARQGKKDAVDNDLEYKMSNIEMNFEVADTLDQERGDTKKSNKQQQKGQNQKFKKEEQKQLQKQVTMEDCHSTRDIEQEKLFDRKKILKDLYNNRNLLKKGMRKDDSGSDSSPSNDELSEEEMDSILPTQLKKKKSQSQLRKTTKKGFLNQQTNAGINLQPQESKKPGQSGAGASGDSGEEIKPHDCEVYKRDNHRIFCFCEQKQRIRENQVVFDREDYYGPDANNPNMAYVINQRQMRLKANQNAKRIDLNKTFLEPQIINFPLKGNIEGSFRNFNNNNNGFQYQEPPRIMLIDSHLFQYRSTSCQQKPNNIIFPFQEKIQGQQFNELSTSPISQAPSVSAANYTPIGIQRSADYFKNENNIFIEKRTQTNHVRRNQQSSSPYEIKSAINENNEAGVSADETSQTPNKRNVNLGSNLIHQCVNNQSINHNIINLNSSCVNQPDQCSGDGTMASSNVVEDRMNKKFRLETRNVRIVKNSMNQYQIIIQNYDRQANSLENSGIYHSHLSQTPSSQRESSAHFMERVVIGYNSEHKKEPGSKIDYDIHKQNNSDPQCRIDIKSAMGPRDFVKINVNQKETMDREAIQEKIISTKVVPLILGQYTAVNSGNLPNSHVRKGSRLNYSASITSDQKMEELFKSKIREKKIASINGSAWKNLKEKSVGESSQAVANPSNSNNANGFLSLNLVNCSQRNSFQK